MGSNKLKRGTKRGVIRHGSMKGEELAGLWKQTAKGALTRVLLKIALGAS